MSSFAWSLLSSLFCGAYGLVGKDEFPIVYIVFGPKAVPLVRAIVASDSPCPKLQLPPTSHAAPPVFERFVGTDDMPYAFPIKVCEVTLPKGLPAAQQGLMTFGGKPLPAVPHNPKSFLLIGDTGLRVKTKHDGTCLEYGKEKRYGIPVCIKQGPPSSFDKKKMKGDFQPLSNWPLEDVTTLAAGEKTDVVVHVGDYLYRQGPCPPTSGCEDIGDGYGDNWPGWYGDFFQPSKALLAAAPWIVVRGNHENCERAGHGWFLFLDPRPLRKGWTAADCLDESEPYAVPFAQEQFLVVDDSVIVPKDGGIDHMDFTHDCPFDDAEHVVQETNRYEAVNPKQDPVFIDKQIAIFKDNLHRVEKLSASHETNFYLSHRPLFAIACNGSKYVTLDWTMQQALQQAGPHVLDRVVASINGHMHFFEGIVFEDNKLPVQLVVGNGGTALIPDTVHKGIHNLKLYGHAVKSAYINSAFGYSVMARPGDKYIVSARTGSKAGGAKEFWQTSINSGLRVNTKSWFDSLLGVIGHGSEEL